MPHIDFKEYVTGKAVTEAGEAVAAPSKLIILHHWDTDGLVCAAMFMDFMEVNAPEVEIVLMNPTINNYFLVEAEYNWIAEQNADVILTTDINFPVDVIDRIDEIVDHSFVFDHHTQTANIDRPGVQNVEYPGCTMLVSQYLGRQDDLVSVSGAIGDQEDKILEHDWWPRIEAVLKKEDIDFNDVLRLTKLIDTSYIVGKQEDLHYAIDLIRKDMVLGLSDDRFFANEQLIMTEFDRESTKEMDVVLDGAGLFQVIESELSLISEVTRARAKAHPDKLIITQQSWGEMSSFYVRHRELDIDLGIVVDLARGKGYNAGGKPEVAGVVIATADLDAFREEVLALLADSL